MDLVYTKLQIEIKNFSNYDNHTCDDIQYAKIHKIFVPDAL